MQSEAGVSATNSVATCALKASHAGRTQHFCCPTSATPGFGFEFPRPEGKRSSEPNSNRETQHRQWPPPVLLQTTDLVRHLRCFISSIIQVSEQCLRTPQCRHTMPHPVSARDGYQHRHNHSHTRCHMLSTSKQQPRQAQHRQPNEPNNRVTTSTPVCRRQSQASPPTLSG